MQTDSHMDVVQDWDTKLLDMWGRTNNEYGVLTTYVHRIEQLQEGFEHKKEVPHLCQVKTAKILVELDQPWAIHGCSAPSDPNVARWYH